MKYFIREPHSEFGYRKSNLGNSTYFWWLTYLKLGETYPKERPTEYMGIRKWKI